MAPNYRLCTVLDFIGIGALAGAVASVLSGTFVPELSDSAALLSLSLCTTTALVALLSARVLQVAEIVLTAPSARKMRAAQAADASNVTPVVAGQAEKLPQPDLQRAA